MNTLPFAILAFAALMHASFQLSVSVLTLLSGHSLSAKRSHRRTLQLTTAFILGSVFMTILLLATMSLIINLYVRPESLSLWWTVSTSIAIVIGLAVWLFYYRPEGTSLWVPRGFAEYLIKRTRATKQRAEAFALGTTRVSSELLFTIAPMFMAALALVSLPANEQLIGIGLYAIISLAPLIVVWMLLGGGHSISEIQRWRETNKRFLQVIAGGGLIILGFFVFVYEVLGTVSGGVGL